MKAQRLNVACLVFLLFSACEPPPREAAVAVPPPLDDRCTSDNDCRIFSDEIADSPPTTKACCSGCTQRAANTEWLNTFRAHCQRTPPRICPPLGCAMPLRRAVCKAGRCAMASL